MTNFSLICAVEELKPADWLAFYTCFKQALEKDFPQYSSKLKRSWLVETKWKKAFEGKRKIFLVAKKKKEVVGFLVAKFSAGRTSWINWLGVKKKFQCQGIGTKLVQSWEKWAKEQDYHQLRVSTSFEENKPFYERLGFELKEVKKKGRYGLDHYVFVKEI